jgi:hypothetical protein
MDVYYYHIRFSVGRSRSALSQFLRARREDSFDKNAPEAVDRMTTMVKPGGI